MQGITAGMGAMPCTCARHTYSDNRFSQVLVPGIAACMAGILGTGARYT